MQIIDVSDKMLNNSEDVAKKSYVTTMQASASLELKSTSLIYNSHELTNL